MVVAGGSRRQRIWFTLYLVSREMGERWAGAFNEMLTEPLGLDDPLFFEVPPLPVASARPTLATN